MKHLVKKYVKKANVSSNVTEIIKNSHIDEKELNSIVDSGVEGYVALGLTKNKMVQMFKYEHNSEFFFIPEPDPIVIYFDTALIFYKRIKQQRNDLFSKLSTHFKNINSVNGDFYWYYSSVANFIIFLFLALEAFINKVIPVDFEYRKNIQNKKTEVYNKLQIQRNIDFLEKIKKILPQVYDKNFVEKYTHKYELIKSLKDFRDDIVHTKSFEGIESNNFYEELFVTSLDFDYEKVLLAARDYINYYQEGLIEECNCGSE